MKDKCYCIDREGKCFARSGDECRILREPLLPCPFKKPERRVTNGKIYDANMNWYREKYGHLDDREGE